MTLSTCCRHSSTNRTNLCMLWWKSRHLPVRPSSGKTVHKPKFSQIIKYLFLPPLSSLKRCKHNFLTPCIYTYGRYSVTKTNVHTKTIYNMLSTAVEQAVACAPVTQRARVQSPVRTSFLDDAFSQLLCQEALGPCGSPNIIGHHNHPKSFITDSNDLWCWRDLKLLYSIGLLSYTIFDNTVTLVTFLRV